jgi:hypothetical protein
VERTEVASSTVEDDSNNTSDTKRTSSVGSVAQYRLGQQTTRAIESSTDTLVPEVEESSQGTNEMSECQRSSQPKSNQPTDTEGQVEDSNTKGEKEAQKKSSPCTLPGGSGMRLDNGVKQVSSEPNGKCAVDPARPCSAHCLMGCDLSHYFKDPLDTDGLTAHHNEVQERLVRIVATHQAEVQALRRDLHSTRVALLRQRSANNGNGRGNEDLPIVDIDSAARAAAMSVGVNGGAIAHSGSSSTGACSDASSTWEAIDEKEANPTLWVPDHAVAACMRYSKYFVVVSRRLFIFFVIHRCNTSFWFGRRKHHCRSCGLLFCRDCSDHLTPIPAEQLYHPVRVCDDCFANLERAKIKHAPTALANDQDAEQQQQATGNPEAPQAF